MIIHVKLSSDLVTLTLFNCVPLISKAGRTDRLFNIYIEPININSVFVMLRVNLMATAISQQFIFDKFWFKEASMEPMSLLTYVRWVSSGYILSGCEFDKQLGKSLIYKRKSKDLIYLIRLLSNEICLVDLLILEQTFNCERLFYRAI